MQDLNARRAVFLDRDGVLIEDVHLLTRREQVRVLPGVPQALRELQAAGYVLLVVTNQTVVARGLATERAVRDVNDHVREEIHRQSGCSIDRFYVCPHHPEATLLAYRTACQCRKPHPGMLLRGKQDFEIDLTASFMVGDRISDITAGCAAGCTTLLVKGWAMDAPPIVSPGVTVNGRPDHVCGDLLEVAKVILEGS